MCAASEGSLFLMVAGGFSVKEDLERKPDQEIVHARKREVSEVPGRLSYGVGAGGNDLEGSGVADEV